MEDQQEKVAAVSKKGVVKAKKAGTTKITAKYGKKKEGLDRKSYQKDS